ncbi:PrpF domain-containing protein [Streptomyces sp. ODS28]|uniref:2-methylaconitate cis-trans isomerase PrpF family protein n=1 Tax=Streptomyces sp. ODS28 TaxID=3136688 RepID=UPI0031EB711F
MAQQWVPAVFMRGGTSKGVFFREEVLPPAGEERDALFLSVTGSPDPYGRQLDGMGGGASSLSKVVSVRGSERADADVEYTFGQVAIDRPVVDYSGNCGNLSSAVGPFAVDEGVVPPPDDGFVTLRVLNTNTGKLFRSAFEVRGGTAVVSGDLEVPGVAGTGAPVRLEYLSPGGARTGSLLPAGSASTRLDTPRGPVTVSCVDASNPVVFVAAGELGLTGAETREHLASDGQLMDTLDHIRREGAVATGLAASAAAAPLANPKVAVVAAPSAYETLSGSRIAPDAFDLAVRMLSMEQVHGAVPGTGALCLAVATQIPGTVPHRLTSARPGAPTRLGTPSGVLPVEADVVAGDGVAQARTASLYRTARPLMRGAVAVPGDTRLP